MLKANPLFILCAVSAAILAEPSARATGDFETDFGTDGVYRHDRTTFDEQAEDLAVDGQGRILVSWVYESVDPAGAEWPAVLRLTPDGEIDTTFGVSGVWIESTHQVVDGDVLVEVDDQDRPLVAWTYNSDEPNFNPDWAVRRLTSAGASDILLTAAFDLSGGGSTANEDEISDLLLAPDGQLVAIGAAEYNGSDTDMAIAVWEPSGGSYVPDLGFHGDGLRTVAFDLGPAATDAGRAVAVEGANLVVAGTAATQSDNSGSEIAVCRMSLTTGDLDPGFSSDGKASYAYTPFNDPAWVRHFASDILVTEDGYLVSGGASETADPGSDIAVLALERNGVAVLTFGSLGWAIPQIGFNGQGGTVSRNGRELFVDAAGRIVVVGGAVHLQTIESFGYVARLFDDGSLDPSFNATGVRWYDLEPAGAAGSKTRFTSMSVLPGLAQILLGGETSGVTSGTARSDVDLFVSRLEVGYHIFSDGFESGDTTDWSSTVP